MGEDPWEDAACGLLTTAPDGTIARVNRAFLDWTGHTGEDLVGRRRFQDLLAPGDRIFHETHYAPLLRMQGAVREIAVDVVCADGRRLPVLVNSVLTTAPDGTPVAVSTAVFRAVDRRAYERELLRARVQAEQSEARARELTRILQESFIPPAPPAVPGLDVAGAYRPAGAGDEVGGDFYDVFELAKGDWAVIVGDVCGKGAGAATVTALARYTLRAATIRSRRPKAVLASLNRALLQQGAERFCTVVYGRLRPHRGRVSLTVATGGHPLPIRVPATGEPAPVGRSGGLLGVFDHPPLHDVAVTLGPGDAVVFFTDGVTEARQGRDFFGDARLRDLLARVRGTDAAAIAAAVVDEVVAFQAGSPRDDIAVVVVRVPPAG